MDWNSEEAASQSDSLEEGLQMSLTSTFPNLMDEPFEFGKPGAPISVLEPNRVQCSGSTFARRINHENVATTPPPPQGKFVDGTQQDVQNSSPALVGSVPSPMPSSQRETLNGQFLAATTVNCPPTSSSLLMVKPKPQKGLGDSIWAS